MNVDRIKRSAIIAAGYHYQLLQGLRVIADWLGAPTRYSRIQFECDDDAVGAKSLDDIVCERTDGVLEFLQVKYSPNPYSDDNRLSWDWLLDKSGPRARSLLRKWFDAYSGVGEARFGSMAVITNRIPDAELERCIVGGRVRLDLATSAAQAAVLHELGDSAKAAQFFLDLEIRHSDKSFVGLEAEVESALFVHSDRAGIDRLRQSALQWSIEKECPSPDGWITLGLVRRILSERTPQPIPEDFAIPDDYVVPDDAFNEGLVKAIRAIECPVFTLTGPPGRGKSTYISFLCCQLESEGIPVVRHHYYLSSTDRTRDRITSRVVFESLLLQLGELTSRVEFTPSRPEEVNRAIEDCGAWFKENGKPLVIVLDGLDHVWREFQQDVRPLDEVFQQLIAPPPNVVVVVGTQPVADEQLPPSLLAACPKQNWLTIPPLGEAALLAYLKAQVEADRLGTLASQDVSEDWLQDCARALRALTSGHPLHVIYAVEELVAKGVALSSYEIERLPQCPGDSIRDYYKVLWNGLRECERDVLRLVCEFHFPWPRDSFKRILVRDEQDGHTVSSVEHLLNTTAAGLRPFHNSLVVFVCEQPGHAARIDELSAAIKAWLGESAPSALRSLWHWAVSCRFGDVQPLVDGLTRAWSIDRLLEGHLPDDIVRLYAEAEEAAFQRHQYAQALRLRWCKTRLLDGPEFQVFDRVRLQRCAWKLTAEPSVVDLAFAHRHEFDARQLMVFAESLRYWGRNEAAQVVGKEAMRRWRLDGRVERRNAEHLKQEGPFVFAATLAGSIDVSANIESKHFVKWPLRIVSAMVSALARQSRVAELMGLYDGALEVGEQDVRYVVEEAALLAAVSDEGDVSKWQQYLAFTSSPLLCCHRELRGGFNDWPSSDPPNDEFLTYGEASARDIVHWFFASMHTALRSANCDFSFLKRGDGIFKSDQGIASAIEAYVVHASAQLRKEVPVSFPDLFRHLSRHTKMEARSYDESRSRAAFTRQLPEIALRLLILSGRPNPRVTVVELRDALASGWVTPEQMTEWALKHPVQVLEQDAARQLLSRRLAALSVGVGDTQERAEALLEVTELALRYELRDVANASFRLCWQYVLAYGSHKDPEIFDVLDGIRNVAEVVPAKALELLKSIGPQVHHVTDYTNGDETRHAHRVVSSMLARLNAALVVQQASDEVAQSNWHRVEDALVELCGSGSLDSPFLDHLVATGLELDAVSALRERAASGDERAKALFLAATAFSGEPLFPLEASQKAKSEDERLVQFDGLVGEKAPPVAFADYPPTEFERFVEALGSRRYEHQLLKDWYAHWEAQGMQSDLLVTLKPILLQGERRRDEMYLLDNLYETSVQLEGRSAAFPILVKAQIEMGGWLGRYFEESDKSKSRLKEAAKRYRERSEEFIQKSCANRWTSNRSPSSLLIPSDRLVYFFCELGELDKAIELVEAMIGVLHEETSMLQLTTPSWAA